jgi:carbohydrate kinase (thermoresistant glucokinase family)
MIVVIMGVSGSGKTTVAKLLAARQSWQFQEGDELHPPENVAKMKSGKPLTDADRRPWLESIAGKIDAWRAQGQSGIVTCSALKRSYRNIIVGNRSGVVLVYLKGSVALIRQRLAQRRGHFMPSTLLDSQFATLEEPSADERPIVVDIGARPEEIVQEIVRKLTA